MLSAIRPQTAGSTACLFPGCPPLHPARPQTWSSGPASSPASRPLLHRNYHHILETEHHLWVLKLDATVPTCYTYLSVFQLCIHAVSLSAIINLYISFVNHLDHLMKSLYYMHCDQLVTYRPFSLVIADKHRLINNIYSWFKSELQNW